MKSLAALGNRIANVRESRNMTQEKLASLAGYSERTIRKAETSKPVSLQTLCDIATALEIELGEILPPSVYQEIVEPNRAVVEATLNAIVSKDIDGIIRRITDDIVFWYSGPAELPYAGTHKGKAEVRKSFEISLGIYEWIEEPIYDAWIVTYDHVVVHGHDKVRVIANGVTFMSQWSVFFQIRNGLICQIRHYADQTVPLKAINSD